MSRSQAASVGDELGRRRGVDDVLARSLPRATCVGREAERARRARRRSSPASSENRGLAAAGVVVSSAGRAARDEPAVVDDRDAVAELLGLVHARGW